MGDYDDDFEIEEQVGGNDDHGVHKTQTKSPVHTENLAFDTTNRNNPRSIPLSTRKVQPLSNNENHKGLGLQNINVSNTPQDFATKPRLKLLDINSSVEKKSFDFNNHVDSKDHTIGGLADSIDSTYSKQFTKPFKIQKRSYGDLQLRQPIENHPKLNSLDKQVKFTKPLLIKKQPQQYNFDDEYLPKVKPNIPRLPQPIKSINNYVHSSERPHNYEKMKKLLASYNMTGRTDREVEEENKNLRRQLREMSDLLTKIIENRDISKILPRRLTFNEKPVEERLRTYSQEIQNHKKTIALLLEEYHSLKSRVEQVKKPEYLLTLDEKIANAHQKIDQIRKDSKQLEILIHYSGKNINNTENPAEGLDDMARYNEKARAIAVLNKRNEKLLAEAKVFREQKADQLKRIDDLSHKVVKLESLAEHYQVRIGKNPLQNKYNELYKEVKAQEDAIKILLNRNEKFTELYFDNDLDELKLSIQRDKQHIVKLHEMLRTQTTTMKELVAKESLTADKSLKDLFDRFQLPTEEDKITITEENRPISKNKERKETNAKKPPLPKVLTEREELYKDLPLFTPKRESGKQFAIKKGGKSSARSVGKNRERSPDDHQKQLDEIDSLFRKQKEEVNQKETPKYQETKPKPKLQEIKKTEEVEKKEEVKQEPVEEKKTSFSKPFSIKRGAAKLDNNSGSQIDTNKEAEKTVIEQQTERKDEFGLKKPDNRNASQFESKYKDTADLNYISNNTSKANYQGQPLRLPDDVTKGKIDQSSKIIPDTNANSRVDASSVNFGSVRGSQNIEHKEVNQQPVQQEIPTEDFGFGASRLNRGRVLKKEETSQELVLNFGGSTKVQDKPATNNSPPKLNNESTIEKSENKPLTSGTKPNNSSNLEIKDPFAKYDDLSTLDLSKKKGPGTGGSKLKFEDDDDTGAKPKESFGKSELIPEKKEEPKSFTLSSHQAGPRSLINSNPFAQPLTLNNQQPLTLNQNKQPQLRLSGDPGASVWSKKIDESEIETIGESKNKGSMQNKRGVIDDFDSDFKTGEEKSRSFASKKNESFNNPGGLTLDNNKNPSIWDKKDKDPGPIGGLKLDGNKNSSIWDKKEKDNEPVGGLKLDSNKNVSIWDKKEKIAGDGLKLGTEGVGGSKSIWDKKEPSAEGSTFSFQKKEEQNSGLSFLNDKPETKESGAGISTFGANKKEGLKFGGGGGGSIWDKKETSSGIKEIGSSDQKPPNEGLDFIGKKTEPKKSDGLNLLNDNPGQDGKQPEAGENGEKKKKKKKKATDSIDAGAENSGNHDSNLETSEKKKKKKKKAHTDGIEGGDLENSGNHDSNLEAPEKKKKKKKAHTDGIEGGDVENSGNHDSNLEDSPEKKKKKKKKAHTDGIEGGDVENSGNHDSVLGLSSEKKKKKHKKPKEETGEGGSNENTEVMKFGVNETSSPLDKKEKTVPKEKPGNEGFSSGIGKKEDKSDVLTFLNDKPVVSDKKDPTALADNTKKPKRLKMGQNEEKKKILADGTQGNDFFDDLDI